MNYSKELTIQHLQNRINQLSANPVENKNLIAKAQRQLKKYL